MTDLFENIQVKKQSVCNHKTTVVEDIVIFCVSCGEEIHRVISTGKDYSEGIVYRSEYDRTKIFIKFLDKCAVDTAGARMEIIHDFEIISVYYGNSKRFMNLNFVLYQLCKKNGVDVDKSKFKLPKSKKSREKHENVCQEIFRKLGWNYFSLL